MNWLLADIGGTNSRCALWQPGSDTGITRRYANTDFSDPISLLSEFVASLPSEDRPEKAWVAIAAPVDDSDLIQMVNIDWALSRRELLEQLELARCEIINDFGAQAHCLPRLTNQDWLQIGGGSARPNQVCAILGPGTGLGVALAVPGTDSWAAVTGEGGHVSLAGRNQAEDDIIRECRDRYGHCSAERLISGPGMTILHDLMHGEPNLDAATIGSRAAAGDTQCRATLEQMFLFLATVASDLAVTAGASGGVYISGGIIPRYLEMFAESGFRERFENKGRYRPYLDRIPTRVIRKTDPALLGLAALAQDAA